MSAAISGARYLGREGMEEVGQADTARAFTQNTSYDDEYACLYFTIVKTWKLKVLYVLRKFCI